MGRQVLVIATSKVEAEEITSPLYDRFGRGGEVEFVVPAEGFSKPELVGNIEDGAQGDAANRAPAVPRTTSTPFAAPTSAAGDGSDAVRAIEDALRRFEIEEVVVVTRMSDETSWRESGAVESARDRFGIPISHLLVA